MFFQVGKQLQRQTASYRSCKVPAAGLNSIAFGFFMGRQFGAYLDFRSISFQIIERCLITAKAQSTMSKSEILHLWTIDFSTPKFIRPLSLAAPSQVFDSLVWRITSLVWLRLLSLILKFFIVYATSKSETRVLHSLLFVGFYLAEFKHKMTKSSAIALT